MSKEWNRQFIEEESLKTKKNEEMTGNFSNQRKEL